MKKRVRSMRLDLLYTADTIQNYRSNRVSDSTGTTDIFL